MNGIVVAELTAQEAEDLLLAFLESRGGTPILEEEAQRVLDWAEHARLDVILLQMVLKGAIGIDIQEGDIVFTSRGEILPTGPMP
jgi:hypothetical protein